MRVTVESHRHPSENVTLWTHSLRQRMVSPLCGLDRGVGFFTRGRSERRLMTAGGDLTGVHVLHGLPKPERDPYHVGGSGVFAQEAVIRTLGETVERYSHFVTELEGRHEILVASHDQLRARGERVTGPGGLDLFSDEQLSRAGSGFRAFRRDAPLGWVRALSLTDGGAVWVPAQLMMLGYRLRHRLGEQRLAPAVTTGSAAHTRPRQALRNAILELIQIDSAMGHWYSSSKAPRIRLDDRTAPLKSIISWCFGKRRPGPRFYWLPNADLPGLSIACVIEEWGGGRPAIAVGLGIDLRANEAMYKALLEVVGVTQLAKLALFYEAVGNGAGSDGGIDPARILDLNRNVAFYSLPENAPVVRSKFDDAQVVTASSLPPDSTLDTEAEVPLLVGGFRDTGKQLVFLDLTTRDVRELGFVAVRVWSPDTISLSLPSMPPVRHPRFEAYGGFAHDRPHPYP